MKREFLTISNILSITRAVLVLPFLFAMLLPPEPRRGWAAAVMVLAALTDRLDGDLARARGEVTEWGKILDPLADKIGVAGVATALVLLGDIPLWFLISLLLRDLLILAGGLFIKIKKGTVPPSNPTGKWTVGLVALTLCAAVLGIGTSMLVWLIWISIAGLVLSLAGYGIRFVKELRSPVTSDTA